MARGFSGFGAALIFVPLGSALVGPAVTASVLVIVDGICATVMVPGAFRLFEGRSVGLMCVGSTLAVPLGTWLLVRTDPVALRWGICGLIFALLGLLMSGWRYRGPERPGVTIGIGATSGLLSGLAQIGGPPVVVYWLGGNRAPAVMRANIVMFFLWGSVLSVSAYAWSGLLGPAVLTLSLTCGPAYLAGILTGSRMFRLASPVVFRRICYALIALAALLGLPR